MRLLLWALVLGQNLLQVRPQISPCTIYSITIIENWKQYRDKHGLEAFTDYRKEYFLDNPDIFKACAAAKLCAAREMTNYLQRDIQDMGVYYTCNFQVLNLGELKTIVERENFRDDVCPIRHILNGNISYSDRYLLCGCGAKLGIDPCGQGALQ